MLPQIILSCFIILALSSCCSARVYDFSYVKGLKPEEDSYTSTRDEIRGKTYKWLKHGATCGYDQQTQFASEQKFFEAKGHCRDSAGLLCDGSKCICRPAASTVWDPKVQYVSYDDDDLHQLVTGKCAVPKGSTCSETRGEPENGYQCVDDATCVFDKSKKGSWDYDEGICQ